MGGFIGYANCFSLITGYTNNATIKATEPSSSYAYLGGIVGYTESSDISNCVNDSDLDCQLGGKCIGGITGIVSTGDITSCQNLGKITSNASFVGGIVGNIKGYGSSYLINIINCTSNVNVTGNNYVGGYIGAGKNVNFSSSNPVSNLSSTTITGKAYVGGFIGSADCFKPNITGFTNYAKVVSTGVNNTDACVGGIAGIASASTFINCHNKSNISTTSGGNYVGGIVGYFEQANIENCTNTGTINSNAKYIGGITGYITNSSTNNSISGCSNSAAITSSSTYAGDIVGYAKGYGSSYKILITNCTNSGSVSATSNFNSIGNCNSYVTIS